MLVRSAGVKTYLYHWVKALQALSPESIRTFLAPASLERLDHGGGFSKYPGKIGALVALNAVGEALSDIAAPHCAVFHCANLLRSLPRKPRLTTTLHDLTSWIVPECHIPENVAADHALARRVLNRADGIIAVSENTKQDAIRILGLAPEKIRVIYPGVPSEYFSVPPCAVDRIAGAYKLNRPYFLFVGTIEPRKNVDTLLTAWEETPSGFRSENELIIAGMPGWRSKTTMARLHQANSEGRSIRYLGYVPEVDMPALTAGARAFVYPSLYEGFGIPVVQAMAAGCPVITSNVSSLPEITDGAAMLVNPRSAAELQSALTSLDQSPDLRLKLGAQGSEKATEYRWDRAAAESLGFFRGLF
jgi:alpha-1,3-rhamnosyl/mannosyltransferase